MTICNLRHSLTSSWAYSIYATLAVVVIYFFAHQPAPIAQSADGLCTVIHVIDGDSLSVRCDDKQHNLRLMHIDAPEIGQPVWGNHAKYILQKLAKRQVYVEFRGKDIYQRDLAIIYPNSEKQNTLNLQLVKRGAVRVYSRYNPPTAYLNAMKQAKQSQRGIWSEQGLHQDPMRYRRLAY